MQSSRILLACTLLLVYLALRVEGVTCSGCSSSYGSTNDKCCTLAVCQSADTYCSNGRNPCKPKPGYNCRFSASNGCYCDESCFLYGDCCFNMLSTCIAPVLTNVRPSNGPTSGRSVTLAGRSFLFAEWSNSATPTALLDGSAITMTSITATEIVATVPAGFNRDHVIAVTHSWNTSVTPKTSSSVTFDYDSPVISAISPTLVPTTGATVTLTGSNFGTGSNPLTLSVAGSSVTPSVRTHTLIQVAIPAGTGMSLPVTLTVGTQSSNTVYYSYAPPTITSFTPTNGPTLGNTLLTIVGTNFGASGMSVTVGGTPCTITATTPHTQIVCRTAVGTGLGNQVKVTAADGQTVAAASMFSYDPPIITSFTPTTAPTSGGSMTITGSNFHTTATVALGTAACAVTSNTDSQIVCTIPGGEGEGFNVRVTVAGQATTASQSFSYNPPTISSVTPSSGVTQGGNTLTVNGASFGTSGFVTIAGQTCSVTFQSHTQIRCTTSVGQGKDLALTVTVLGRTTAPVMFSYLPPTITSFAPATANTQGSVTLTLTGTNFGTSGTVTVGGNACPPTGSAFSHTSIQCTVPAGSGANVPIVVTVGGQTTSVSTFAYNGPSITSITPTTGTTGGNIQITLQGNSFGTSGAVVNLSSGGSCPIVTQTHTVVVCTLPAGSGSLTFSVTVGGQTSNTAAFSYAAPTIAQIAPTVIATQGGTIVTITGSSFDTSGTVTIDGAACTSPTWSHSQVVCTSPAGMGANRPVQLKAAGHASLASTSISYSAPSLSGITPSAINTDGTTLITVTGANFGTAGTVKIGGVDATQLVSWSQTSVVFRAAAGQGQGILVQMFVASQSSNTLQINYLGPTLSTVTPSNGPTAGSTTITLTGANFGMTATVSLGASPCAVTGQSHSQIICTTPPGQGSSSLQVSVGSQVSASLAFTYDPPSLTGVTPANGPTAGGNSITISGSSLGTSATVTLGGQTCPVTSQTHSQIVCTAPPNEGTGLQIQAIVANVASNVVSYSYDAPVLSTVNPTTGGTAGGYLVTVTGTNFGLSGQVRINSASCATSTRSHTQIVCTLPAGMGLTNPITVSVGARTSNSINFAYSAPTITSVAPQSLTSSGGSAITITGTNFGTAGSVTVDGFPCYETSTGFAQTSIRCTLPASQGANRPLVVTVGGQTASSQYTYAPPTLTSVSPSSADTGGNVPITISGASLGTSGSVTVGGVNCPIVAGSWTHTQVVCTLPPGKGSVVVQLTSASRSATTNWAYNGPSITSITPNVGPTAGGTLITISGSSLDNSGTVTVDGNACTSPTWTHTSIICTIPAGQGVNRNIVITTAGSQTASSTAFSYAAPSVTGIAPSLGLTAGGTSIVLTGSNFGVSGPTVTVDGLNCPVTASSSTSVTCTAPGGVGLGKLVQLTVGGQASNTVFFGYNAPTLTSITPNTGPTGGGFLATVVGTNFGPSPVINIGGSACTYGAGAVNAAQTQVVCTVPGGSGTGRAVQANVASQLSNTLTFSYDGPVITSVTPTEASTLGGTPVTIVGSSLGTNGVVTVGNALCAILTYSHSLITCTLPPGEGASVPVKVSNGVLISNTLFLTYPPPAITSVNPTTGSTAGGITVTVTGTNFGLTGFAQLNGVTCVSQGGVLNHATIQCTLPAGTGTNRAFVVTVAGQVSNPFPFSYAPPTITNVDPSNGPTVGGTTITITGVSMSPSATVKIGDNVCAAFSSTQTYSYLECQLAEGSGTNLPVVVTVDGQVSASVPFNYDNPSITSVAPSVATTDGGVALVLTGNNFATSGTVTVGGQPCVISGSGWTHTRVECTLPAGTGTSKTVQLTTVSSQTTSSTAFSYAAPTISAVTSASGFPTLGGVPVTVAGSNFGTTPALASIDIDGTAYPVTSITSDGAIFTLPPGVGTAQQLKITVDGQTSSTVNFARNAPVISTIRGCPTDNGDGTADCAVSGPVITITGLNLGSATLTAATVYVKDPSLVCADVTYITPHLQFTCTLPAIPAGGFNLAVTVNVGTQSTSRVLVSYAGPEIMPNSISFATPYTPSTSITSLSISDTSSIAFRGKNMGNFGVLSLLASDPPVITYGIAGKPAQFTCTFDRLEPESVGSIYSRVYCNLNGGFGQNLVFTVTVGLQVSQPGTDTISFPAPTITPNTIALVKDGVVQAKSTEIVGTATEGEFIYFEGQHWSTDASLMKVYYGAGSNLNEFECNSITSTANSLSCRTASGTGGPYVFTVIVNGLSSAPGTDKFKYPVAPTVENVKGCPVDDIPRGATTGCPTSGNIPITITGQDFPADMDALIVYVGSSTCLVTSFSSSVIVCTLPAGRGTSQPVVVVNSQFWSRAAQLVSYAPPVLTSIQGCTATAAPTSVVGCPRNGGTSITLTGTAFGASGAIVLVSGIPCTNVVHDAATPHTKVTCTLPQGTGNLKTVLLIQGQGSVSTNSVLLSYLPCAAGSYAVGSTTVCTDCPAGSITTTVGQASCTNCDAGTYATGTGNTRCQTCAAGSYSGAAAGTCTACTPGFNAPDAASVSCPACTAGKFSSVSNAVTCVQCEPGTAQGSSQQTQCVSCTAGHYQGLEGQPSCLPCAAGTATNNPKSTECTSCTPGWFQANPGQATCEECPVRTAQSLSGQNTCVQCDDGKYQNVTGQATCALCSKGKFSVKVGGIGALQCTDCPIGQYQAADGQATCLQCPFGKFQDATGTSVCQNCAIGYHQDSTGQTACLPCAKGKYAGTTGTIQCTDCPAGFYQDQLHQGSCTACPAGKYQPSTGQSECLVCPKGTANALTGQLQCTDCLDGSMANETQSVTCMACELGKFSKRGPTDTHGPVSCTNCPVGTYADSQGTVDCTPCLAGSFAGVEGREACQLCEAGTISGPSASVCVECAAGKFAKDPGSVVCSDCQPGSFAKDPKSASCTFCDPGFAQSGTAQSNCVECTAGFYSDLPGAASCTQCPAGKSSTAVKAQSCTDCAVGTYQPNQNQQSCPTCPNGQYQDAQGQITCKPCSAGSFTSASTGKNTCTPCAEGKYAGSPNSEECTDCEPGRFAVSTGSLLCNQCDAGTYTSTPGQRSCQKCTAGWYQPDPNQVGCIKCPKGTYMPSEGASSCLPCPIGTFTDADGLTICTPCPEGTFSEAKATVCTDCAAGKFAFGTGNVGCTDCDAGKFSALPRMASCTDCAAGKYRPDTGKSFCLECEVGKSQSATGQAQCIKCAAGSYSNTTNLSSCYTCEVGRYSLPPTSATVGATECTLCEAGKYQAATGQIECVPCPVGSYNDQTERTVCKSCEAGRFQNDEGKTQCKACLEGTAAATTGSVLCPPCDAGKFATGTANTLCTNCEAGRHAELQNAAICTPCPLGTFATSTGSVLCLDCPVGKMANTTGLTDCHSCEAGKYQKNPRQSSCTECEAGSYTSTIGLSICTKCDLGSAVNVTGAKSCTPCNPGYFAPTTGRLVCEPCGIGSYAPSSQAFACLDCEPGRYAPTTGHTLCNACDPGTSQLQPGSSSCVQCVMGKFAALPGQPSCTDCVPGTYNNVTNALECMNCERGKYSSTPDTCLNCPLGSAAPNERSLTCDQCTVGTIAPREGMDRCDLCEAGKFQSGASGKVCDECPIGTYSSTRGQPSCEPCPSGEFSNTTGLSACLRCSAGTYSRRAGNVGASVCSDCGIGTYQGTEGQAICPNCPVGFYQNETRASTCKLCEPGYFADVTGRTACFGCPLGHYTPASGTIICKACSAGSFAFERASTTCSQCQPGEYQSDPAQTGCNPCPDGHYSANPGSAVCQACEPGSIAPETHVPKSSCLPCDPGLYQNNTAQTTCLACPAGQYATEPGHPVCVNCPQGTFSLGGAAICSPCPAGSHQNKEGSSACLPCELGKYMNSTNQPECTSCEPGKYGNALSLRACINCAAGSSATTSGQIKCDTCQPGKYALEGQPTCSMCSDGTATNNYASSVCVNCGALAVSSQDRTMCECIVGYYLPSYKAGSNEFNCIPCVEGADCTVVGTTWLNLKALPGYWRPSNTSSTFIRCPIPEQCTGGAASSAAFAEDGSSGSGCAANRAGIACSHCADGYRPSGIACVPCPEGDMQWTLLAVLIVVLIILIWITVHIVLRSGEQQLRQAKAAGGDDEEEEEWDVSDDDDDDEDEENEDNEQDDSFNSQEPSVDREAGDDAVVSEHSVSRSMSDNGSGDERARPYPPPPAPPRPVDPEVEMANLGGSGEESKDEDFTDSDFIEEEDSDEGDVAAEIVKNEREWADKVKLIGPPPPVANFTYKFKIFLSFLQITNSVTSDLDFRWPEAYKTVMSWLGLSSLDSLISNVTGTDCFSQDNYYFMYVAILGMPLAVGFLILFFWVLPRRSNLFCWRHYSSKAKRRNAIQTWRLFLYFIFLVFPIVSSKVLRHYICDDIDGTSFLAADYRVKCFTDLWNLTSYVSTNFILLYPIGIPVFFFVLLRYNRKKLATPDVKAQLGFLYAGYKESIWWWEIVDSLHKLFLVAVLAFFPTTVQLPIAMAVVILYMISLLLINPYQDPSDDRLHQIAQTEIYLVILAGYLFESFGTRKLDTLEDIGLSIVLLFVTFGFVVVFLVFAFVSLRSSVGTWCAKRDARKQREAAKKEAAQAKEARRKERAMNQAKAVAVIENAAAANLAAQQEADAEAEAESAAAAAASAAAGGYPDADGRDGSDVSGSYSDSRTDGDDDDEDDGEHHQRNSESVNA